MNNLQRLLRKECMLWYGYSLEQKLKAWDMVAHSYKPLFNIEKSYKCYIPAYNQCKRNNARKYHSVYEFQWNLADTIEYDRKIRLNSFEELLQNNPYEKYYIYKTGKFK